MREMVIAGTTAIMAEGGIGDVSETEAVGTGGGGWGGFDEMGKFVEKRVGWGAMKSWVHGSTPLVAS